MIVSCVLISVFFVVALFSLVFHCLIPSRYLLSMIAFLDSDCGGMLFQQFKGLPRKKSWLKCQCLSKTTLQQVIKPWHVAWTLAAVSADPFRSKTAKRCFRDAASPTVKEVLEPSVFSETNRLEFRLVWQVLSGFLKEQKPFSWICQKTPHGKKTRPYQQLRSRPSFLRTPYPPWVVKPWKGP